MKKLTLLAVACSAVVASQLRASDLLTNGNLDLDTDVNNLPDAWVNWTYGDTAFAAYKNDPPNDPFDFNATPYVNAGNYGEWWTSGGGWFQVNAATAGTAYTFTAASATEGWDNAAGELRLIWLDETNAVISQDVQHTATYESNKPWTYYAVTATAPANTTQVKVEFATWGARGAVLWDDASLVAAHVWNVDGSGNFADAGNWLGGAPGGAGSVAQFNSVITTGPQTVNLADAVTLGEIRFNNSANSYVLGGAGSVTLQDPAGSVGISAFAGTHTVGVPVHASQNATFNVANNATLNLTQLQPTSSSISKVGAGNLVVNNVRASALNVVAGSVRVASNGGASGTSNVGSLSIATSATLDLADNDLIVTSGTYAAVTSEIARARNGGMWDQPGLTSSAALAASPRNKTLGTLTGEQYLSTGNTTFNGFTVIASDVLVKFTYYGDTDLNGIVNFDDYARTDAGFNGGGTTWFQGDNDYNGLVNFDDYSLLDLAFNTQSGTLIRAMDYLEGEDRSMQGMNDPALRKVVEHFAQFGNGYATSFLNAVPEPTSSLALFGIALAIIRRRRRRD